MTTPESREAAYLKKGGGECPFCHSGDISGGHVENEGPSAWQKVSCGNCGAEWCDNYKLVGIEELEQPGTNEDDQ